MATNATATQAAPAGSLEDLYERTAPAALRLAYFVSGDRELAQDLVQGRSRTWPGASITCASRTRSRRTSVARS
jgi:hypothetical protein